MDFGVASHKQTSPNAAYLGSAEPRDENFHGSVNLKHQRSGLSENTWKSPKMPKPGEVDFSSKKANEIFTAFERSKLWPPSTADDGQKMLSFSSSQPHFGGGMGADGSSRSIAFSICQDENNSRNGGGGLSGGVRGSGTFTRLKGPFTPSQWMELEHQALIYKHIVANVPVPSNLLAPIKRALYSYGSTGSYASNFLGWGPFHLGFSGSNDPEPGRCRRTDGKKWRCSRDAVPDQKYCERHINRGRHRSRKPVEGHTGHAVSGSTSSKVALIASSSPASVICSSSASNSLSSMQHQFSSLQPTNTTNASTNHLVSRSQGFQGLSLIPPTIGLKSKDASFSTQKQHVPFNELSHSEFGIVSSDSLLNPSERIPYMNSSNTDSFMRFNAKEANNHQPVHHFIDDWRKDQSDRASASWPEELKSDWTQLSMSIPITSDFSSSSGSPAQDKSTISTLRLSHELDPTHMSLGANHYLGEQVEKQSSWSPVIWGNLMGGPLGEVLTITTNGEGVDPARFSSMKAWKSSPQLGSSPTGVLQKSTFVSLSNSSSGSSPHSADNKKAPENASLCNDLLGSTLVSSAAISSLYE